MSDLLRVKEELRRLRWQQERERGQRTAAPIRRRASLNWRYLRRKVFRISKSRTARICGVSRNTVARWEDPASDSLPDVGHIGTLVRVIGGPVMCEFFVLCGLEDRQDAAGKH